LDGPGREGLAIALRDVIGYWKLNRMQRAPSKGHCCNDRAKPKNDLVFHDAVLFNAPPAGLSIPRA
jgi:hypothetical protein